MWCCVGNLLFGLFESQVGEMKRADQSRCVLISAVAGVCMAIFPLAANAQYQTENNSGRALDANNRLGSGGTNEARPTGGITPNDIVYGTVTRGKQFRAPHTVEPTAFRGGGVAGPSDNLVRDTGVSVYDRGYGYDPGQSRRVWTDRFGVNPPSSLGYEQLSVGSPAQFVEKPSPYRVPGDLRMDAAIFNPDLGLSRPNQYILPISAQPANTQLVFAPPPDIANLPAEQPDLTAMPSSDLLRRLNLSEAQVRAMREEFRATEGVPSAAPGDLTQAPEAPINDPLRSDLNNSLDVQSMTGSLNTNQSLRQRLATAAPMNARANTQYAQLQERLTKFHKAQSQTDQEANQEFLQQWQQLQEQNGQQPAQDKGQKPLRPEDVVQKEIPLDKQPAQPQDQTGAGSAADRRTRVAAKMQLEQAQGAKKVEGIMPEQPNLPIRIASFADGVKATGLKNLLTDAEKAMQSGKFTQALDYYDAAASVAPDNSMVLMGRSITELGAGYYARAQTHLEQVMSADPSLLLARYDLKAFFGDDRLQYIVRDLKDLAQTESRQARPLFLLAFVAYNSDNPERAADYLNLAQQRGGSQAFYDQLREYWQLNPKKKNALPAAPMIEGK